MKIWTSASSRGSETTAHHPHHRRRAAPLLLRHHGVIVDEGETEPLHGDGPGETRGGRRRARRGEFGSPESLAEASEDPSAVTLREDFNGSVAFKSACAAELAKCEVAYSEVGLLAIMPWGTALSVVPVAARMSVTEKLVKAKSTMNEIVACGADETACSATRTGANETRKCHACYCAGLQYNTHATDGPGHSAGDLAIDDFSDKEIAEVREQCDAFFSLPVSSRRCSSVLRRWR